MVINTKIQIIQKFFFLCISKPANLSSSPKVNTDRDLECFLSDNCLYLYIYNIYTKMQDHFHRHTYCSTSTLFNITCSIPFISLSVLNFARVLALLIDIIQVILQFCHLTKHACPFMCTYTHMITQIHMLFLCRASCQKQSCYVKG